MSKVILGFVGQLGSGKGTASNLLRLNYGAAVFAFGDILHDILKRLYLSPSRENLQKISQTLRENFGQDVLAKAMEKQVEDSPAELIVVDGIRRMGDIQELHKNPGFHLIEITAPPKVRFERVLQRPEKPDEKNMSWEDFVAMGQREAELMIVEVAKQAEKSLDNSGDMKALEKQLEELIKSLKK